MKIVSKTLLLFSCLSFSFFIEAKQIELQLNKSEKVDVILEGNIDDNELQGPWHNSEEKTPRYCRKIQYENNGAHPVENFLPTLNKKSYYTHESLAEQLSKEDAPLKALYKLWTTQVNITAQEDNISNDPLYILNFKGYCHQDQYVQSFIKLCSLFDVDARLIAMHGKENYDFCYQGIQWEFLDPIDDQFYLSLNNKTLVSSEEVMDDPFLALRTKTNRKMDGVDFKEAWRNLAHFEIVESYLGDNLPQTSYQSSTDKVIGFKFYPSEKIIYHANAKSFVLHTNERVVEHVLNPNARFKNANNKIDYTSPFPLREINNSTTSLISIDSKMIQPGESYLFANPNVFSTNIEIESSSAEGLIHVYSTCSNHLYPALTLGANHIDLGTANDSLINIVIDLDDSLESKTSVIDVVNQNTVFKYCTPSFELSQKNAEVQIDKVWWQISTNSEFDFIPSNFEQVESFSNTINLPNITDTFFNSDDVYYFRVKGSTNGQWNSWSAPYRFKVKKPEAVTKIDFEKLERNKFQISWDSVSDEAEYLIFASNSLDFLPSVYFDKQINSLIDGKVANEELNNNMKVITKDSSYIVDGSYAYYRIIARENGQLSVPSRLIHVYDEDLHQPRDVLQIADLNMNHSVIERTQFPQSYEMEESSILPIPNQFASWENKLFDVSSHLPSSVKPNEIVPYTPSPYLSAEIWASVKQYFLPENHPVKPKLDRMFSKRRVMLSPDTFKAAGFVRYKPGRVSHILASAHPKLQGFFFKGFPDVDLKITNDWEKLANRIRGALSIEECIKRHGYQKIFKVPKKWLYPLPANPSPPKSSKILRKNFILVAEDMRIYEHDKNNDMYKKKMTRSLMEALFVVINEEGLADSLYAFNVPFCKDGKLAFIDTEWHHRWPVNFPKFKKYFSSKMGKYWDKLVRDAAKNNELKK
ncbi:MAG: hypothetical protein H0W88_03855 [Parachlamydiaceae bacterium]|nr:hypothetical protein [Parachlamydiaceae bacterium]